MNVNHQSTTINRVNFDSPPTLVITETYGSKDRDGEAPHLDTLLLNLFFFFSSLGWSAREGYGNVEGERPLGQLQPKTLLVVSIVAMLYRHYS